MVEIKKSHNLYKPNNPLDFQEIEETKGYLKDILEVEPCPNCGKDMIAGKCSDSKICGYGHGQDFLDYKNEKKLISSITKLGDGKKHDIVTIGGEKFSYFNFFGRIKEDTAIIQIEVKGEVYKFEVNYSIKRTDFSITIEKIKFNGKIEKKIKNRNGKEKWVKDFFDYNILRRYAFGVLADIRFNKFLK